MGRIGEGTTFTVPARPGPLVGSTTVSIAPVPMQTVTVEKMAAGGDALGRLADGRVVFVGGALPDETVRVQITEERRDYARARVVDVVEASPWRTQPPCPYVAAGCGGCGWQHIEPGYQLELKAGIVRDALRRTARLPDAVVTIGGAVDARGYRTTARLAIDGSGRAGMRAAAHHRVVELDDCLVSHPGIAELFGDLRADQPCEVSLRIGVASGQRTAMVHHAPDGPIGRRRNRARARPTRSGPPLPAVRGLPGDVGVGPSATVHETVAGVSLQVSAASFFQSGAQAADLLVAAVRAACGEPAPGTVLLDAYGGIGLFGATLQADRTVLVESSAPAANDARRNLRDRDATVHHMPFERWTPEHVDVAVADPARSGLGAGGVDRLVATGAATVVLVSCDPVSMARDVSALIQRGYHHYGACVLDPFPYTSHVEVVTRLRAGAARPVIYGDPGE